MSTLVSFGTKTGAIRRYECGGMAARLTHCVTVDRPQLITPNDIFEFHANPSDEFKVDPPPRPTGPPSGVGTTRAA